MGVLSVPGAAVEQFAKHWQFFDARTDWVLRGWPQVSRFAHSATQHHKKPFLLDFDHS
jgi:hypothetical protein